MNPAMNPFTETSKRPPYVSVIAVLVGILAAFNLVFGVAALFGALRTGGAIAAPLTAGQVYLLAAMVIGFGALLMWAAVGLFRGKRSARIVVATVAVLQLISAFTHRPFEWGSLLTALLLAASLGALFLPAASKAFFGDAQHRGGPRLRDATM